MEKLKQLWTWTPELYFIALLIWWAIDAYLGDLAIINYPAIIGLVLIALLIPTKNKVLGLIISSILGILSFYLILALVSDLQHTVKFDKRAFMFLLQGGLLIIGNLTMATLMFLKYLRTNKNKKIATVEN